MVTTSDGGSQARPPDASSPTRVLAADGLLDTQRVLVIAPHPDDEVLGAGAPLPASATPAPRWSSRS